MTETIAWDLLLDSMNGQIGGRLPSVSQIDRSSRDPFAILMSTILSLRTRDKVTLEATERLLNRAATPAEILKLDSEILESLIYPVAFFRVKAGNIQNICRIIMEKYHGRVPADKKALLEMPGVGLKTCNLVLSLGFGIPAICVDIHVHRIANRMGWIKTDSPDQSEKALSAILPVKHWIRINEILVAFGQDICTPQSPHCSKCSVRDFCRRKNVEKSR